MNCEHTKLKNSASKDSTRKYEADTISTLVVDSNPLTCRQPGYGRSDTLIIYIKFVSDTHVKRN